MTFEKNPIQNAIEKAVISGNVTVFHGDPKDLIKDIINSDKNENCKNCKEFKKEIQKLMKQNEVLQNDVNNYKDKYNVLLEKQNKMEEILDDLNINDNFDGLTDFLNILYENKDLFLNLVNNKNINNNINIIETPEYIEIKNINEKNNTRILELETKLRMLDSNIEDNDLFKQIKMQNDILLQNNKTLNTENEEIKQRLIKIENNNNNSDINISDNKQDDNIDIDFKIKESIKIALKEQQVMFDSEYKKLKEEKDKIIDELKTKIEKKSNKNKVTKDDKNTIEYLYKGFTIYNDTDVEWKVIAGSFTYKKFKMLYDFNESIKSDKNVNQDTYNEVIEYLNDKAVLNSYGKRKKLSPYYRTKLKRISKIYNLFDDKLINVNINTGFITSLSKNQFEMFINILNNELNKENTNNENKDDNINLDINDNIIENENNSKKCGNFGYGCSNYVNNRTYCKECMKDGYFTTDDESD